MKNKIFILLTIGLLLASAFPQEIVRADVAPPETPPGANVLPEGEATKVRMTAETVTLTIAKDPADAREALAKTEAVFTMRNLGFKEERMRARFPLSFFNGNSDGFGNFPEIKSIAVKINGSAVSTQRELQPFFSNERSHQERAEIPWATFDVVFPPAQDVVIEVVYAVSGFGYYPYENFKYILETGAGWYGTIGVADIIVHYPYPVSKKNVWVDEVSGYGTPISGGVLSGNEIRWHFENLEPTWENNVEVIVVTPSLWESVVNETDAVAKNPNDGEAWGRLAKAYKEVIRMPKGYLRDDPAGREMFDLSKSAYEKCLAALPNDSLWHSGYAELLWAHYYFDLYWDSKADVHKILPRVLSELQTALTLDPHNQHARDLLTEISYSLPNTVKKTDSGEFILLGLTATPMMPTPYGGMTPAFTPTVAFTPAEATSALQSAAGAKKTPSANPICGTAFVPMALLGLVFVLKRKRKVL